MNVASKCMTAAKMPFVEIHLDLMTVFATTDSAISETERPVSSMAPESILTMALESRMVITIIKWGLIDYIRWSSGTSDIFGVFPSDLSTRKTCSFSNILIIGS